MSIIKIHPQHPLIVIGGPTASGKSSLGLKLAIELAKQKIPTEIICADSITVYRGFDIGSAKPTPKEQALIPHHLLDIVNPMENFTAGDFIRLAVPLIERLRSEGKVPLVIGGTGFYLRALLRGMASGEEDQAESARIKQELEDRASNEGWEKLHQELLAKDPSSRVHPNDHYRIIRALQAIALQAAGPHEKLAWSELNKTTRENPARFPHQYFRLKVEKESLKTRIEERTKLMLDRGLVAETKALLEQGIPTSCKPMQSIGYREAVAFLQESGTTTNSTATLAEQIVQSTMKLAKQQNTWFRGEELAEWIEPSLESLLPVVLKSLQGPRD